MMIRVLAVSPLAGWLLDLFLAAVQYLNATPLVISAEAFAIVVQGVAWLALALLAIGFWARFDKRSA